MSDLKAQQVATHGGGLSNELGYTIMVQTGSKLKCSNQTVEQVLWSASCGSSHLCSTASEMLSVFRRRRVRGQDLINARCWQSQRVETLCWPSAEWCQAPVCSRLEERGDRAPGRKRLMRSLIAARVWWLFWDGGEEVYFEDSVIISNCRPPWKHKILGWVLKRKGLAGSCPHLLSSNPIFLT